MAVPEQKPIVIYSANGSTNRFPITFDLHDSRYLDVLKNKELVSLELYSVENNKEVVLKFIPEHGDEIILSRSTRLDRPTDFNTYDNSFRPEALNFDLNKIWHTLQEQYLIDAQFLSRLKGEIETRRTSDSLLQYQIDILNDVTLGVFDKASKTYLNEKLSALALTLSNESEKLLNDLSAMINQAASNISGNNNWTDLLIKTWTGKNQNQENKAFITSAKDVSDIPPTENRLSYFDGKGVRQANGVRWNQVISNDSSTPFTHHLDIQCKFPWAFSDYESQLALFGLNDSSGYIMGGGFTIVEEDNSLWTLSGATVDADGSVYLRKYNLDTGAELGFYRLNTQSIGEGLVITNYYGGWKAFIGGRQDGYINEFNISLTPDGTLLNIVDSHFVDLYNQFSFHDGVWVCESKTPEVVAYTLRNVLTVFNANFEPTGQLKLPVWSSGHITDSTNKYSRYLNKRQGFAVGAGFIVCSFGGAYDHGNVDHLTNRTKVQGIRVYGFDGSLLHESMFRPDLMLPIMQDHLNPAFTQTRIENEGVYVSSTGEIYTLFYYASRSQTLSQRKSEGVVIFKHVASKTSKDYAAACAITPMHNIQEMTILGRYNGGATINPLTGETFTTISDIIDYMRFLNIPRLNIHTGGIGGLVDIDGSTVPIGINLNMQLRTNTEVLVTVNATNDTTYSGYRAVYNPTTQMYSKASLYTKLASNLDDTNVFSRLLGNTVGTASGASNNSILVLDAQDNGLRNLVVVGGGSSAFGSANEVRLSVNKNYTGIADYSGSWSVLPTTLRPRTDNYSSLGDGAFRLATVYAATGSINTSDERYKQQFRSQTDKEKSAALRIKKSICFFKFNDMVELKGDSARWHVGVRAQEVIRIMQEEGLDPFEYGFVCFDAWDAEEEIIDTWADEYDEDGELIREASSQIIQPKIEAGSRYAIRYDELAMFIIANI